MKSEKASCLMWFHKWGKWNDLGAIAKHEDDDPKSMPTNIGTKQARRCERCNKLQLRIEWAK